MTYSSSAKRARVYVDGRLKAETTFSAAPVALLGPAWIGGWGGARPWEGIIDEVAIFDHELTAQEVFEWVYPPKIAKSPNPADGQIDVPVTINTLSWAPGAYTQDVNGHDVYFGYTLEEVAEANTTTVGIYKGRFDTNSVTLAQISETLDFGQTYYWRVDQVNNLDPCSPYRGHVWSFTTIPYQLIDDFESYTSTPELYAEWEDYHTLPEQGGEVYLSYVPVYSGAQAMRFVYDWNYGVPVTRRTFDTPQNWTELGLSSLWLWFYGDANDGLGNTADGMYITLADADDDKATIFYGDSRTYSSSPYSAPHGDANDLWRRTWYQWGLSLQDFNEANNVNPDKIKSITIGITGGTRGEIYFDDFQLYQPYCIPELAEFDITGDCITDEADLAIMAADWLVGDYNVVAVDPGTTHLKHYWDFNEGSGTVAHDSVGSADGTLGAEVSWVSSLPGYGTAIQMGDFGTEGVFINHPLNGPSEPNLFPEITVTMLVRVDGLPDGDGDWWNIMITHHEWVDNTFQMEALYSGEIEFIVNSSPQAYWQTPIVFERDNWRQWYHVAMTYSSIDKEAKVYINGILVGTTTFDTAPVALLGPAWIGSWGAARTWEGVIDEVRIYDCVLSQAEIAYLAGESGVYQPVLSEANFYDQEPQLQKRINFKDFAILADHWLEEDLWP